MNKLNIFLSFVLLSFCLLINVSYADFSTTPISCDTYGANTITNTSSYILGISSSYTYSNSRSIINTYLADTSNESNKIIYEDMLSTLNSEGINLIIFKYTNTKGNSYNRILYFANNLDFGVLNPSSGGYFCFISNDGNSPTFVQFDSNASYPYEFIKSSTAGINNSFNTIVELYYSSKSIKLLSGSTSSVMWDGSSYYYEAPTTPEQPEAPIMPTNSEIASVVQSFYDSDLYKNNTNFKDFMVVYSFVTGYYSIIGTDNHLLQEIYYDGAKPSNDDFTYPETWWRFYNYFGNAQNFFYGWDYWLYSTRKENDVFLPLEYNGVGKINDLFNLKFTNQSVIVYSSYEYEVYEFRPPTEEGGENQVTNTTVPGNEFTYDENLDPTDSNYSPIQNYIPANPSQTILGNVDFDEINKTFEENKDILNIEGANWLFTANNKLVGYFIGFLSLLIVFLIISRILGG